MRDGQCLGARAERSFEFAAARVRSPGSGEVYAAVPAVLGGKVLDRSLEDGCGRRVVAKDG